MKHLALTALLAGILAGCATHAPTQAPTLTYDVVSDLDYVPYIYKDESGDVVGLEVDILTAIAKNQGFDVRFVPSIWDTLFDDMTKHNAKLALNGMAVVDVDDKLATPSDSYMQSLDCMATTNPAYLNNWQSRSMAVVFEGEIANNLLEAGIKPSQFVEAPTQQTALKMVGDNQANLAMGDCTALRYYIKHEPMLQNYRFVVQELPNSDDPKNSQLVFGVAKNPALIQQINDGLATLRQTGELDKIKQKWGQ
ncbi:MAG: transporter substrate-binding domain-containing protein [Moraxella sp.]|uniref:transporter substrate-binding domain-containing protein n=1 Tax=Moraxella sp. TaxID=479 RepID=UPI0026DB58F9|nr:transporter substrate-binding domain-containing protein [Moraxella sp.]MDO4449869.1 transporter substrate-binding domain-containing protein [Moraxella sp.]